MEALGRLGIVVPVAEGVLLSLKNAGGATFFCLGDDVFTLKSAATYDGSATDLATIVSYYTCPDTDGSGEWTYAIQAAADSITIASGMAAVYVDAADLPDGANYAEMVAAESGTVIAWVSGLYPQRQPPELIPVSGSSS